MAVGDSVSGSGASAVAALKGLPMEHFVEQMLKRGLPVAQVVSEADTDNSGDVDLDEFTDLCINTLHLPLGAEDVAEVFKAVDTDGSGTCSAAELTKYVTGAQKALEAKKCSGAIIADEGDLRRDTKLVALVAHNNMKRARGVGVWSAVARRCPKVRRWVEGDQRRHAERMALGRRDWRGEMTSDVWHTLSSTCVTSRESRSHCLGKLSWVTETPGPR